VNKKREHGKRGVALDIGTTTLAAALVSTETERPLKTISAPNPQVSWGSDVLERINAIKADSSALQDLVSSLQNACKDILRELCPSEPPAEITVAGNSIMEHFFLGLSPACLSEVPYKPLFRDAQVLEAGQAPLDVASGGRLYVFPLIGGFVGGDAVAAALAMGLRDEKANTLVVDLGTNSEIILKANGRLLATSAAAGPAFEAAGITNGMTATEGAISHVRLEKGRLELTVIGKVLARGICGSGLIDAVSTLLREGIIEESGRIRGAEEIDSNLAARIQANEQGNSFVLHRSAKGTISLTQGDIRALQLAKAAIRAGISTLLRKAGIGTEEVQKVFVAGAFGSNLSLRGLIDVGLLDPLWAGKIHFAGDAALMGAVQALDDDKKEEAQWIARNTTYQPLSGGKAFEKEFIGEMNFPCTFPERELCKED